MCVTWPGEAPGATGCVKGGSQLEFPVYVKKLVHCDAVTRFNVSTGRFGVGGAVVGSHAAIWSASELASGTNEITDPFGTSDATALLRMTVVAVTLSTVVPGAMPVPKTDMPARIPLVDAKVNVAPEGASTVVDAVTGTRSDRYVVAIRNVISEPSGTSPATGPLSVMVVAVRLCTVVPAGIFGPDTDMSGWMPAVDAKVRILPEGQSTDVFALMGLVV